MRKRSVVVIWLCGLLLAALSAVMLWRALADDPPGPSVVLVTLEMTRADHLGVYGYPFPTSPTLDALAERSVVFDNALTPAVLSLPAHSAILTGQSPESLGIMGNLNPLPKAVTTIAERLSKAGYHTAGFTGVNLLGPLTGMDQGFERFEVIPLQTHQHSPRRLNQALAAFERAEAFLDAHHGKFFLWVHAQNPHFDFAAPESVTKGIRTTSASPSLCVNEVTKASATQPRLSPLFELDYTEGYDAEIATVDAGIARLLKKLKAVGADERTTVIVAGDHGVVLFDRPPGTRVDHDELFTEVTHVPLIVHAPGHAPARVNAEVVTTSIASTIAEVTGLRWRGESPSLLAPEVGEAVAKERFWYASQDAGALRGARYKLITSPFFTPRLYEWRNDPAERVDLAPLLPDVAERMERELQQRQRRFYLREVRRFRPSAPLLRELRAAGYLNAEGP